jgi:hypothetical protein
VPTKSEVEWHQEKWPIDHPASTIVVGADGTVLEYSLTGVSGGFSEHNFVARESDGTVIGRATIDPTPLERYTLLGKTTCGRVVVHVQAKERPDRIASNLTSQIDGSRVSVLTEGKHGLLLLGKDETFIPLPRDDTYYNKTRIGGGIIDSRTVAIGMDESVVFVDLQTREQRVLPFKRVHKVHLLRRGNTTELLVLRDDSADKTAWIRLTLSGETTHVVDTLAVGFPDSSRFVALDQEANVLVVRDDSGGVSTVDPWTGEQGCHLPFDTPNGDVDAGLDFWMPEADFAAPNAAIALVHYGMMQAVLDLSTCTAVTTPIGPHTDSTCGFHDGLVIQEEGQQKLITIGTLGVVTLDEPVRCMTKSQGVLKAWSTYEPFHITKINDLWWKVTVTATP